MENDKRSFRQFLLCVAAKEEVRELLRLVFLAAVLMSSWLIFWFWHPAVSIMSQDAIQYLFPYLQELKRADGHWQGLIYRAGILGGVKMHEIYGTIPLFSWLTQIGFSIPWILNLCAFFFQLLFAYFGLFVVEGFADFCLDDRYRFEDISWWTGRLALALLLLFVPVLAWRLEAGHLNLLFGLLAFFVPFALFFRLEKTRLTFTTLALAFLALMNGLPVAGQQMLVYGAIFVFPIFLAVASKRSLRENIKQLLFLLLLLLFSLFLVMPRFAGELHTIFGDDSARQLGAGSIVYSYVTEAWQDLLNSLFWFRQIFTNGREPFLWHETHYAFGPFLLCLPFLFQKRSRRLAFGFLVSLVLALLFCMNLEPYSSLLLHALPILNSFRVPGRALLLWSICLSLLGLSFLLFALCKTKTPVEKEKRWKTEALLLLSLLPLSFLPFYLLEPLCWIAVVLLLLRKKIPTTYATVLIAIVLSAGSIGAFREKVSARIDMVSFLQKVETLGQNLKQKTPELFLSLNRVRLQLPNTIWGPNLGSMLGVSSLNGYAFPTRRFLENLSGIWDQPYEPNTSVLGFVEGTKELPTFEALYNVAYLLTADEKGLRFSKNTPLFSAWLSGKVEWNDGSASLAKKLKQEVATDAKWRNVLQLSSADIRDQQMQEALRDLPNCSPNGSIEEIDETASGQSFHLLLKNAGHCVVTLPMNYISNWHAKSQDQDLLVFPAYGSLTSVFIPAGVTEFNLNADAYVPWWASVLFYLGIVGTIALFASIGRFYGLK